MRFGLPELIIILVIVMLLFGATKLPQLGHSLGKSIGMFKKGLNDSNEEAAKDKDVAKTVEVAKNTDGAGKSSSTPQH